VFVDTGSCGLTRAMNNLDPLDVDLSFSVRSMNSRKRSTGHNLASGMLSMPKPFNAPHRWVFLRRSKEKVTPFSVNLIDCKLLAVTSDTVIQVDRTIKVTSLLAKTVRDKCRFSPRVPIKVPIRFP
jgi:hypothetical protein